MLCPHTRFVIGMLMGLTILYVMPVPSGGGVWFEALWIIALVRLMWWFER